MQKQNTAVIKVIGVGGGGVNALNRMIESGLTGVEFIAINTDAQQLLSSNANIKIDIGRELTRGLGAGADPDIGYEAAQQSRDEIKEAIAGADMVFITAGEGGGTGTGAAPVVAEICKDEGALTVAIVTQPFSFEGYRRIKQAKEGIIALREKVDTIVIIPNDKLSSVLEENISIIDAFKKADTMLLDGVSGITDLITNTGIINTDFADIRSVLLKAGTALISTGISSGENRAVNAANLAINSPLLDVSIKGAKSIVVNITGPANTSLSEVTAAMNVVHGIAHQESNIIHGLIISENGVDEIKITIIAAGFDDVQQDQKSNNNNNQNDFRDLFKK
jgi:cell division protein FtsZ